MTSKYSKQQVSTLQGDSAVVRTVRVKFLWRSLGGHGSCEFRFTLIWFVILNNTESYFCLHFLLTAIPIPRSSLQSAGTAGR